MEKPIRKPLMILCLIAAAFLAACGAAQTPPPAATAAPTTDTNALRTEVAATVLAQVPQICAQTPAPTSIPPTATVKPTSAQATETAQSTPLASFTPGVGTPTVTLLDQVKWVSQTVADGTNFQPDTDFTLTWRVKNTGTSTWTDKYVLRFFAGNPFGAPNEISLGKEVKPGEMVDITLNMKTPRNPGEYTSTWVMSTAVRSNFKDPLFLTIVVVAPTKTPTLTKVPPTATPTK